MLLKARTAVAALAVGVLSLTACGGSSSEDSASAFVNDGALTVCTAVPYDPFEYVEDGEYTGFDIELSREIATGLGLELQVQNVSFDGLQSGTVLAAGQCDMIAAAMSITDEREDKLAFSDPYYESFQSLLVPADSAVAGFDDLSGRKLGVQQGTTGALYAQDNTAEDTEVVSFESEGELFQALGAGTVDAVLQDLPVNQNHTDGGKFTIAATYETDEVYGFAMRKTGSEELVSQVNEQLTALRDNGMYQELHEKYFAE